MKRILIRADDLGYSEGVNYGIAKSMIDGVICSVGLMSNMPTAEHGVQLVKGHGFCLGQHTNICAGTPLTDPERIPSLVDENGNFKSSKVYRSAEEDFVVLEEAILEVEAQYQRFVELTGQQPQHFGSHAVKSDNFFRAVEIVAERHDLPFLGSSLKGGPILFRHTKLYTAMDSMKPDYDPFESLKAAAMRDYGEDGCCMFVCHPGYLDEDILQNSSLTRPRPLEVAMSIDPRTKQWLDENQVKLVTFNDLP